MGSFGKYAYSEGRWTTDGPTAVPFLLVDIHDSRIATIDYRAADASGGRFFLGYEPRFYFDEPDAGHPVDTAAESQGFTAWVKDVTGTDVDPTAVAQLRVVAQSDEGLPQAVDRVRQRAARPAGMLAARLVHQRPGEGVHVDDVRGFGHAASLGNGQRQVRVSGGRPRVRSTCFAAFSSLLTSTGRGLPANSGRSDGLSL